MHSFKSRGSSHMIPSPIRLFPPLSITPSLYGIKLARGNCCRCVMVTGLIKHDGFTSFALVSTLPLSFFRAPRGSLVVVAGHPVSCQMKWALQSHVWATPQTHTESKLGRIPPWWSETEFNIKFPIIYYTEEERENTILSRLSRERVRG